MFFLKTLDFFSRLFYDVLTLMRNYFSKKGVQDECKGRCFECDQDKG